MANGQNVGDLASWVPTGYIQRISRKCAHDENKTMKWVLLQFSRQECVLGNLAETIILSFDTHFVLRIIQKEHAGMWQDMPKSQKGSTLNPTTSG
jgi:hypothetical protein